MSFFCLYTAFTNFKTNMTFFLTLRYFGILFITVHNYNKLLFTIVYYGLLLLTLVNIVCYNVNKSELFCFCSLLLDNMPLAFLRSSQFPLYCEIQIFV